MVDQQRGNKRRENITFLSFFLFLTSTDLHDFTNSIFLTTKQSNYLGPGLFRLRFSFFLIKTKRKKLHLHTEGIVSSHYRPLLPS